MAQAVQLSGPLSVTRAKQLASRLCRFLAVSGWDQTSTPDLTVLLTAQRIDALVVSARMSGLSAHACAGYRTDLRRIGRAVGSVSASTRRPRRTAMSARAVPGWVRAAWWGPFPAVTAAMTTRGYRFDAGVWTGLGSQLRAGGSLSVLTDGQCAKGGATGTVNGVRRAAAALAAAGDVDPEAVTQMGTPTSRAATPKPKRKQKPMSRSARLAAAKAAMTAATEQSPRPQVAPLEAPVAAAIAAFYPLKTDPAVWARIESVTREALTAYRPASPKWVSSHGGWVSRYVAWVAAGIDSADCEADGLTVQSLCTEGLVEAYLAGPLSTTSVQTRSSVRTVLRRVVRNVSGTPTPERIGHQPVQPPYAPAQCAAMVRLSRNQPTVARRRALSAVVALGLGAGLDARDQRRVAPDDVSRVDLGDGATVTVVTVRGPRPRTVVMRQAYVALLDEAVALHVEQGRSPSAPLFGLVESRHNVVCAVTGSSVTATGRGVEISAARLRATWLVAAMCARVPLAVLLNAAGLRSARTLADLLAYCPPPVKADIDRVLAALDDGGGDGGAADSEILAGAASVGTPAAGDVVEGGERS
ncbi:MAG: hypothetical protein QG597_4357 [Actinomycetota bacterium]|nr:hypothetical protein [Actinomycetota bacterium]